MINIQAKDFNGNAALCSVSDILSGPFLIDTQRLDGLYTPVLFGDLDAIDDDLDADEWHRLNNL